MVRFCKFIIIVVLAFPQLIFGQEVTKENFESAVDFVNKEVVRGFFKIYINVNINDNDNAKSLIYSMDTCTRCSYEDIKVIVKDKGFLNTISNIVTPIELTKVLFLDTLSVDSALDLIIDNFDTVYKYHIKPNNSPTYKILLKDKDELINSFKDSVRSILQLNEKYFISPNNQFHQINIPHEIIDSLINVGIQKARENPSKYVLHEDEDAPNTIGYKVSIIVLILVIAFFIYQFIVLKRKVYDFESKNSFSDKDGSTNNNFNLIQNIKEVLEINRRSQIMPKINELLKSPSPTLLTTPTPTPLPPSNDNEEVKDVPDLNIRSKEKIFFMPQPNEDGTFGDKYKTDKATAYSLYKFTVNEENSNEAIFEFIDSEIAMKRAIKVRSWAIEPVCESENVFKVGYTRIINNKIKPGVAYLNDEVWKVNHKLGIKYE